MTSYPQGKTGTQLCPSNPTPQGHKGQTGTERFQKRPSSLPNGPLRKPPVRDTRDTFYTPTTQANTRKWTTRKSTPQLLHAGVVNKACVPCVPAAQVIHSQKGPKK